MKWYEYLMPWRWGRVVYFTNPYKVNIEPYREDYKQLVVDGFWHAAARLEAGGYCKEHKHDIKTIKFVPGTEKRPKGWAVVMNGIPVGGWKGSKTIGLVVDPITGSPNPNAKTDSAHEWGHAMLDTAHIARGSIKKQHEILASVGL